MNDTNQSSGTETDVETITNRSEVLAVIDAKDCNPNGNPLSTSNRPRIDPVTNQAVITDVRIKRYLRDQLAEDGHGVYITKTDSDREFVKTREDLIKDCVSITDPDEVDDTILNDVLDAAVDIRLFGAVMSLSTNNDDLIEAISENLPRQFTGPFQLSPSRSLNKVVENTESSSLTAVIATGKGKKNGGYELDDHRIKYGVFPVHGVVNEHSADTVRLTETDVERLDTLFWRSIKNQTNTRSKKGQEPRLYVRVEYVEDSYHAGINDSITLGEESKPDEELRNINDVSLDITSLITRLEDNSDVIERVTVNADSLLTFEHDGDVGGEELVYEVISNAVGENTVDVIDVYDEYNGTLPENSQ